MRRIYNALKKSLSDFYENQEKMEEWLNEKVEFDFYVDAISGDGLVLGNRDTSTVASLADCLSIIKKNGKISKEEHDRLSF